MGCQCAKSNEPSNMNLETAPPKITADVEVKQESSINMSKKGKTENVEKSIVNDTINQSKQEVSKVDDSKVDGKKKKKKKVPAAGGDFNAELFELINRLRANPQQFEKKIIEMISNIKTEEGKLIYDANGTKVALVKGVEAFQNASTILASCNPMLPLVFQTDLVIPIPEDQKEWKNQKTITELLGKRKVDNGIKYLDYLFNMDLGVSDPETCLLLQIIDDSPFKGKRRDNILNPSIKNVGINSMKQKSKFCTYLAFAK